MSTWCCLIILVYRYKNLNCTCTQYSNNDYLLLCCLQDHLTICAKFGTKLWLAQNCGSHKIVTFTELWLAQNCESHKTSDRSHKIVTEHLSQLCDQITSLDKTAVIFSLSKEAQDILLSWWQLPYHAQWHWRLTRIALTRIGIRWVARRASVVILFPVLIFGASHNFGKGAVVCAYLSFESSIYW